MNLFFDTSALIKYFHREEGTDTVTALIQEKAHQIYVLEIARIEMLSAVFRRYRNHEISDTQLDIVLNGIEKELAHFTIEPLDALIIQESLHLMEEFGKTYGLRTLDSLHLASLNLIDENELILVSSDHTLCKTSEELGFTCINPTEDLSQL